MNDVQLYWKGKGDVQPIAFSCRPIQKVFPRSGQINPDSAPTANHLFWGCDHQVLAWLLANGYRDAFDCIYLDPPYLSDNTYYAQIKVKNDKAVSHIKKPVFHDRGYESAADYLQHLFVTLGLVKQLLSPRGSVFIHLDWHASHYVKIMLDEVFSRQRFINEIVWCYGGGSGTRRHFHRKHDIILWYSREADYMFSPQHRPYSQGTLQRGLTQVKGDRYRLDQRGALLQDWWTDIPKVLSPTARNNWKYPTQKPVELLQRILLAATEENSLVGDFYAGSGTTGEACERLGRRWVQGDESLYGIQTTMHRLVRSGSRPFQLSSTEESLPNAGTLRVKTEHKQIESGQALSVTLLAYQPDGHEEAGMHLLDFWEIGYMKQDVFISLAQALPEKRGRPVPLRLTVPIDDASGIKPAVQVWDVLGGRTWAEI